MECRYSINQIDVKIEKMEVANATGNGHMPLLTFTYPDGFKQGLMLQDSKLTFIANMDDRTKDKSIPF